VLQSGAEIMHLRGDEIILGQIRLRLDRQATKTLFFHRNLSVNPVNFTAGKSFGYTFRELVHFFSGFFGQFFASWHHAINRICSNRFNFRFLFLPARMDHAGGKYLLSIVSFSTDSAISNI
tara:strand:- start:2379 stop:2741 length:363 start_codon:yes stop_codon:yes gene_type:complete